MALDMGGGMIQAGGGAQNPASNPFYAGSMETMTGDYTIAPDRTTMYYQERDAAKAARVAEQLSSKAAYDSRVRKAEFNQFIHSRGGAFLLGLVIIGMSGFRG